VGTLSAKVSSRVMSRNFNSRSVRQDSFVLMAYSADTAAAGTTVDPFWLRPTRPP
jgi:hypothetical protein